MRLSTLLARHWPEYLIEAFALGCFMVSAGAFTVLIDHPDSWVYAAVADADIRRALIGVVMGATAMALVYSPWGRRSGAHMNPALTLAFLRLGKIAPGDALFYVLAQFAGGVLGVLIVVALFGERFTAAPVAYVATLPGRFGAAVAFAAELVISVVLVYTVLSVVAREHIAKYAGVAAGILVATFITIEGPLSGMSMNPARSFASAAPAGLWSWLWIYFIAPPLGMLLGASLHARSTRSRQHCAKLIHSADQRCIHCGYDPDRTRSRRTAMGELQS